MATIKSKSKFNLIVFLLLAMLAVGVYMVYRASHAAVANPYNCPAGTAGSPHPLLAPNHLVDKLGNDLLRSDQCVHHLQFYLQNLGYTNIPVSGIYDGPTTQGVKDFQASTRCHCPVTGEADKATWIAIHGVINPILAPPPSPSPAPAPATAKPKLTSSSTKSTTTGATTALTETPVADDKQTTFQLPAVIDITKFPNNTLLTDSAKRKVEPIIALISLLLVGWMLYLLRMLYRQFVLPSRPRSKSSVLTAMPKPTLIMPAKKAKTATKTRRK